MELHPKRVPISTQIARFCRAAGIPHDTDWTEGRCVHLIDGRRYTPGQAADMYLPGGFIGSYPTPGRVPLLRLGQTVRVTLDGVDCYAEVILIVGAKRYDDGFVAVVRSLPPIGHSGMRPAPAYAALPA